MIYKINPGINILVGDSPKRINFFVQHPVGMIGRRFIKGLNLEGRIRIQPLHGNHPVGDDLLFFNFLFGYTHFLQPLFFGMRNFVQLPLQVNQPFGRKQYRHAQSFIPI